MIAANESAIAGNTAAIAAGVGAFPRLDYVSATQIRLAAGYPPQNTGSAWTFKSRRD